MFLYKEQFVSNEFLFMDPMDSHRRHSMEKQLREDSKPTSTSAGLLVLRCNIAQGIKLASLPKRSS